METSGYKKLERELKPYKKLMNNALESILDQEITKYPIFVVHQHDLEIGIPLIEEDAITKWRVNASSLEEFVSKQIIEQNKIDSFRTIYKSSDKYFCLFVLSEFGAKFIFLPRIN